MSDYQTKPGNGAIFKNEKKQKDTHPDYNGNFVQIDGKEMEISLWVKESKNGKKYFSVAVKEPYKKPETTQTPQQMLEDDSSDLPFSAKPNPYKILL